MVKKVSMARARELLKKQSLTCRDGCKDFEKSNFEIERIMKLFAQGKITRKEAERRSEAVLNRLKKKQIQYIAKDKAMKKKRDIDSIFY